MSGAAATVARVPRSRRLPAVAACLIAGALAAPAGAATRAPSVAPPYPPGFFGTVIDRGALAPTADLGAMAQEMRARGVRTLSAQFAWAKAQPYRHLSQVPDDQRASYTDVGGIPTNFGITDHIVGAAAAAHITVYPIVVTAPLWARLHPERQFSPPASPSTYAAYLRALVRRYGPRGSFWTSHRSLPRVPIRRWQVWNEPDIGYGHSNSVFWDDDQYFLARYRALLRASHDAVKALDPGAQIALGGLVGQSWVALGRIYSFGGYRRYYDVIALHDYTDDPRNVLRVVSIDRAVMNAHGDRAKAIDITEIGWPAFRSNDVGDTPRAQLDSGEAHWLTVAFGDLVANRVALHLEHVLWYTWLASDQGTDPFDYTGLVHWDGLDAMSDKPSLAAFTSFASRAGG